jgi:curved DNA-binding protein CbpA
MISRNRAGIRRRWIAGENSPRARLARCTIGSAGGENGQTRAGSVSGMPAVKSNLYATLGLARDADSPTIRRAYRARAKAAHPDVGGSEEQFALIKLAYDVLMDDARRAHYDETGEIEDNPADNHRAHVLQTINAALDASLQFCVRNNLDPLRENLISHIRGALKEYRDQAEKLRGELFRALETDKGLLGRFMTEGDNALEQMVRHRVEEHEKQIAQRGEAIRLFDDALVMLAGYSFRAEPGQMVIVNGMSGFGGSGGGFGWIRAGGF